MKAYTCVFQQLQTTARYVMSWFLTSTVFYVIMSGESVGAAARSKMLRVKYTDLSLAEDRKHYISSFQQQRRVIRVCSDLDILEIT